MFHFVGFCKRKTWKEIIWEWRLNLNRLRGMSKDSWWSQLFGKRARLFLPGGTNLELESAPWHNVFAEASCFLIPAPICCHDSVYTRFCASRPHTHRPSLGSLQARLLQCPRRPAGPWQSVLRRNFELDSAIGCRPGETLVVASLAPGRYADWTKNVDLSPERSLWFSLTRFFFVMSINYTLITSFTQTRKPSLVVGSNTP